MTEKQIIVNMTAPYVKYVFAHCRGLASSFSFFRISMSCMKHDVRLIDEGDITAAEYTVSP